MNIQQRLVRLEIVNPPKNGGLFTADSLTIEVVDSNTKVIQTKVVNFNKPKEHGSKPVTLDFSLTQPKV